MTDPTFNRPLKDPAIRRVAIGALVLLLVLIVGLTALSLALA